MAIPRIPVVAIAVVAVTLLAGCGGSAYTATSPGSKERDTAAQDFDGAQEVTCNADPDPEAIPDDPANSVYPCRVADNGFNGYTYYCFTFTPDNEVVKLEKSYIQGLCG